MIKIFTGLMTIFASTVVLAQSCPTSEVTTLDSDGCYFGEKKGYSCPSSNLVQCSQNYTINGFDRPVTATVRFHTKNGVNNLSSVGRMATVNNQLRLKIFSNLTAERNGISSRSQITCSHIQSNYYDYTGDGSGTQSIE